MRINDFHRKYEGLSKEDKFALITPTSFFVIFKQLEQARAQKRYFEKREEELLHQAEEEFNKLNNG